MGPDVGDVGEPGPVGAVGAELASWPNGSRCVNGFGADSDSDSIRSVLASKAASGPGGDEESGGYIRGERYYNEGGEGSC